MAPSRRKKAAAAAAARRQWKVGDLVLAKVKGFPAWPATVSEPEKWGYSSDWKKVLVYFFGTKQIAFCNPADVEEFTEEKKVSLLGKRQGRGADFVRAVKEIVDCFEKLKEQTQVEPLNSGGTPAEKAAANDLNASDTAGLDASLDSRLKPSQSSGAKDEPSHAGEDTMEVESSEQRGASEEPTDDVGGPSLAMPSTYTLRKKSRSSQAKRSASQKKASVQRSRNPSKSDSGGLNNGLVKCNGEKDSGKRLLNGFWDGPLRRAKRSKRSPEGSVPNVEDSPVCNSNGTVEDNGSEIAMAESETLSNNEGSAIESKYKREQSEVLNESCDRGLELSRRLDLQAKTAIVRKKRNPGRRRAISDVVDSTPVHDQEISRDVGVDKEARVLPAMDKNIAESHTKDEGDEHLPLVKRARVRMGKMLSEEQQQQQLGSLLNKEENPLKPASTSKSIDINGSLKCDDVYSHRSSITAGESILCSPVDKCLQVSENKSEPQLTSSDVSEPVPCPPLDNCAPVSESKPQPWKARASQQFGCSFDGEAALPPSKRLHRALEAMSANAAEENQTVVEAPLSPQKDVEMLHPSLGENNSNILVDDVHTSNLELLNESSISNKGLVVEFSRHPDDSDPPTSEIITKSLRNMSPSDSSTRTSDTAKVEVCKDDAVEMTCARDDKDVSCSGSVETSDDVCQGEPLQTSVSVVDGSSVLVTLTNVPTKPSSDEPSETGDNIKNVALQNNESLCEIHAKGDKDTVGEEINRCNSVVVSERDTLVSREEDEALNISCNGGTIADLSDEGRCSAATESVIALVHESAPATGMCDAVKEMKQSVTDVNIESSSLMESNVSSLQGHIVSDKKHVPTDLDPSGNQDNPSAIARLQPEDVKLASQPDDFKTASTTRDNLQSVFSSADMELFDKKHVSGDENKGIDIGLNYQAKSGERVNLAEVKAALASFELTLGSLTRTKESIGRSTRIAVDCVKFGVATEVVDVLVQYMEKESSLYRRIDLFFLVDSIAQSTRGLKGDVGVTYISVVKDSLARIVAAAAPAGQAAKENRRQCLKVLRLWSDRRFFPDSIILQHMRELESQNCSSSGGYSRRMSRTERSFDDPLRDMEGMLVDEYGSNSSFQLPGFCMPRMLKEDDDGSESDGGSFEAVTPEHDSRNKESCEISGLPTIEKHRHILEDVDGELEMEDVAPSCDVEIASTKSNSDNTALRTHPCEEQFSSFVPPLPHDVPPRAPPLPSSPPPPPPPPPPPVAPHPSTMAHANVDPQLHGGRNSMPELMPPRPPAPVMHPQRPMPESTSSCSYSSYPPMHNPVASGNNHQPADSNMYHKQYNNVRPPYPPGPPPSNQFPYYHGEQQIRPSRDARPPSYYDRHHYNQSGDGHFYGEHDSRPPRHEYTENWGYSRQSYPGRPEKDKPYPPMYNGPSCEPPRPRNHGWGGYPPRPVHHRNHFPNRPPCDGAVPVSERGPGYWGPR